MLIALPSIFKSASATIVTGVDTFAYSQSTDEVVPFINSCRRILQAKIDRCKTKLDVVLKEDSSLFDMEVVASKLENKAYEEFLYEIALKIVGLDGLYLENFKCYANDDLIAGVAVAQNRYAFSYASKELRRKNGAIHVRYAGDEVIERLAI